MKVKLDQPRKNKRGLNQDVLHLLSRFDGSNFNLWWLLCGRAPNGLNYDFWVKFLIEGQDQWTPKSSGI